MVLFSRPFLGRYMFTAQGECYTIHREREREEVTHYSVVDTYSVFYCYYGFCSLGEFDLTAT